MSFIRKDIKGRVVQARPLFSEIGSNSILEYHFARDINYVGEVSFTLPREFR